MASRSSSSSSSLLSPGPRILFLLINVVLGIAPSFAFFVWVERNASLPWVGLEWGWPWISLQTWPTLAQAAWDFGLILAFGFVHSLFAQAAVQRGLERLFPAQAIRTVYMAVTGLSVLAVMGLWQSTGIVLWAVPLRIQATYALSVLVFWGLMAVSGWIMARFDPLQFVGLKQLYRSPSELSRTEGQPELLTSGLYARVRHPIYTFTLLAFLLAPVMTLDRMIVSLASIAYLAVAIPLEERKLVAIFGQAYEAYRKRVPAVVPRLPSPGSR